MFEIIVFLLMLAFAGLAYYGGYRQGRLDAMNDIMVEKNKKKEPTV